MSFFRPGARIAVVAPSGDLPDPARFERGLAIARAAGLYVQPLPDMRRPHRYLAGPDEHRAEQLMTALSSPEWDGVWMARGGYGLTRILHRLEPERIQPKPVLGFSDGTALFAALVGHTHGPLLHAPVVNSLQITDEASLEHLFDLLLGRPVAPLAGEVWVAGEARGWLLGGNLSMFAALCGTPWQVDADGAIVVIEEVGEAAYRIDRLLQQLVSSGFFSGVRAVGFGQFVDCALPPGATYTHRDVVLDHLGPLGIPVVGELPVGHGAQNRAFPWLVPATLAGGALSWSALAT